MKRFIFVFLLSMLCLTGVYAESPEEREAAVTGYVALTFDDGPSGPLTEQLLDGLKARNARATFFLCGYRMDQYPASLSRYIAEGHELGVHSTIHTDLTRLTPEELHQDMKLTAQKIFAETGVRPRLMRPPGGSWNEAVALEAQEEGLSIILWSLDPKDWASHNTASILSAMAGRARSGDVILLHDMSKSSVTAALQLVDRLQKEGFSFVTISELAALTGRELVPGQVYEYFPAFDDPPA